MEPTTKKLRPYQVRLVTDVCRATEDVLVEQPTGSGKTVQIVALVAMRLGQRFSHAVISAPQEQIEQGFVKRDYQSIAFPECQGVAQPAFDAPAKLIRGARLSGLGSVKQVAAYLRQPGPADYALACTHAALNQLTPEKMPEDLSGKALFIDEAHHASADGLSQLVALWRERGGQLFFFTATPYRGDGRPVRLDGMRAFRRSLAEHMAEGFAPRHLESEIVALGQPGDAITAGQFTGEEAPPSSYFDGLVAAICRRWLEDGKPKAIVRVPPMQGGRSGELVGRLTQALASQGARVLDATGTGAADKQRFLGALEAEKSRTHATSAYDVMVGIQRVLEGTDWPVCSAVYCVGMPGSLNTVVQFLGRAMRLKGEDYPAAQRDRARLVFFVPCGGGAALADLSLDHSRHALLTCCFLADHEVGQEWIVLREVRRGIEAALGRRTENPAAADAENEADEALDPEVRAEVELVMADARKQIVSSGGEPTVGEVMQLAAKTRPDLPKTALHRVAAEILAGQGTSRGAAVREAIHQEVARRLRIDPMVKQAMAEAFAVVLEEFRDATLKDSAVLESVGRQVHRVTGGQMREFAQRLCDAVPRPLNLLQVKQWVIDHFAQTGDYPSRESGEIRDTGGESWSRVDAAMKGGLRGFLGGSSLAQFLEKEFGVRNHMNLPVLTREQIKRLVTDFVEMSGHYPNQYSGEISGTNGGTWAGLNAALAQGVRGLPGGSSLARFLDEEFGVRNIKNPPRLTREQIKCWVQVFYLRTGTYPAADSGPIPEADGETWQAVNLACWIGRRGMPGGSSLAQFLEEEFGVPNRSNMPKLTREQIREWVLDWRESTGRYPTRKDRAIPRSHGETWAAVNDNLASGSRGLAGGSSLPRFLEEEFGVRNRLNTPKFTLEQIKGVITAWRAKTGDFPSKNSGVIPELDGVAWRMVDKALRRGSHGLPGGSSLPQFLEQEFGTRNLGNLPPLAPEQIKGWIIDYRRKTGRFPVGLAGAIPGTNGETWRIVDKALIRGSRGLPGGSSLFKFIQEHFPSINDNDC